MSFLLLNPPNPSGYQANRDYMGNFGMLNTKPGVVLPPLHLIQMGGTLPAEVVHFIDAAAEDLSFETVTERIRQRPPTWAIVMTSTPTFVQDCQLAHWLKTNTSAKVYLYGPQAAHVAKQAFTLSHADGILAGYSPTTLHTLQQSQHPADELTELMVSDAIGLKPPLAPTFDMNQLPFGCWAQTPLAAYRFDLREPTPFATMRSSLGCVYACAYCPYVLAEGQRFMAMSAERTYAEMEYLSRSLHVRFILFRDLLFTAQKKRIHQLCDLLLNKPLHLTWRAETSTQHLDQELIAHMARAGCTGLNLGVESVDEASASEMALIAKRKDLAHVRQVFAWCRHYGIRANALFVIGFPEDSAQGIAKSITFAKSLAAQTVQFSFAMPFPGTALADIAKRDNLIEDGAWHNMTSLQPVMRTRYLSREEVRTWGKRALRSVYCDPKRWFSLMREPRQGLKRAYAFIQFYRGH